MLEIEKLTDIELSIIISALNYLPEHVTMTDETWGVLQSMVDCVNNEGVKRFS